VAFARGPGPFTAGRISTATAQGLGLALGVPLLPVSSLAALAHGTGHPRVAAAIEAGQGEVYWGLYRARGDDGQEAEAPEAVVAPGEVAVPAEGQWLGAGSGWDRHGETLAARLGARLQDRRPAAGVSAASVAALARRDWQAGQGVAPAQALPTYLRASYAQPPG
jgi:tRNA threonylcarbamoyladenosine biosynthesis protein TsaB